MGKNNKGKQLERTPQENEQMEEILAQYHKIAKNLANSRNEEQVGDALSSIFDMTIAAQIGLLKALAKERTTPAADIVLAVNTYAPVKEVRKEARRSLIQLEGSNIYPVWTMPSVLSLADIVGIDAFDEDDEDDEDEILDGENVIEHFLRFWDQRDFELAYDLLAANSPLKEGLTREEWAMRRQAWVTAAEPTSIKIDVGYTLEVDLEDLSDDLEDGTEELDAFWSLEMKDVPESSSIPELPTATIVLPATGRHWFWSSYTFLMEDDALRIHSMRDKGAEALQLPPEKVEARLQEITQELQSMAQALAEDDKGDDEEDEVDELEVDIDEVRWFTKQSLHYCDALLAHPPTDDDVYEGVAQQAVIIGEMERAAAYFTIGVERFPEARGDMLRSLGAAYIELTIEDTDTHQEIEDELEEEEDAVQAEYISRYFPLAEKAFRDAIAADNAFTSYILLAELFVSQHKKIDEAKALYEQVQGLATTPSETAAIEVGRARIALAEDNPEKALDHYQRAVDLVPNIPGIWQSMGEVQLSLEQKDAAEESFLKSIEFEPTMTDAYAALATLYVEDNRDEAAIKVLEQGIATNPFASDIIAAQAMLYVHAGDMGKAEELIERAEEIDPDMEMVFIVRQVIELQKLQAQQRSSDPKSTKHKKRR
ncbi:MAG: hypothetical protein NVS2B2_25150 [Ktedonobacteraceae bacterium]